MPITSAEEMGIKIPQIKQMDYSMCVKYVKYANNSKKELRVGILAKEIGGLTTYKAGDIVLFQPYTFEDGYMRLDIKELQHSVNHCTVHSLWELNGKLTEYKTIVYVPLSHIAFEIV